MPESNAGELAGLVAVVTGSSSGIGQAITIELARAGADVVVHGAKNRAGAETTAAEAAKQGVKTQVLLADLADPAALDRFAADAWQWRDGVDIWVNNAGVDTLTGEAARWTFEQKLAALWPVDVVATMRLSRAIGQRMKARGRGVILNIGWDQAELGMAGDSGELFAATKGAVMSFTRSLAKSLAPTVRVNCIAPGWVKTAWGEAASQEWQNRARRESLLGRWGLPQDIASAVCYLASPRAEFITGQVIAVNGGRP